MTGNSLTWVCLWITGDTTINQTRPYSVLTQYRAIFLLYQMNLFFQFITFPLPSPNYFLFFFFLITTAYLSLTGGTSYPRSACWCIPLVTGWWDSVVQPASGTSGDGPKGRETLCSHACCSSAQKCLPGLCKTYAHDASMFWRTATGTPNWGFCGTFSHAEGKLHAGIFCCKGPKICQEIKYVCRLRCTQELCVLGICGQEGHVSLWLRARVQPGRAHTSAQLGQQPPGLGKQLCCL